MQIRQGDVLLESARIPKDAVKKDNNVIAHGEATGHAHVMGEGAEVLVDKGLNHYVQVIREHAVLSHEEHALIEIPAGTYKVIIQREFDFMEGIRKVRD